MQQEQATGQMFREARQAVQLASQVRQPPNGGIRHQLVTLAQAAAGLDCAVLRLHHGLVAVREIHQLQACLSMKFPNSPSPQQATGTWHDHAALHPAAASPPTHRPALKVDPVERGRCRAVVVEAVHHRWALTTPRHKVVCRHGCRHCRLTCALQEGFLTAVRAAADQTPCQRLVIALRSPVVALAQERAPARVVRAGGTGRPLRLAKGSTSETQTAESVESFELLREARQRIGEAAHAA